MQDKAGGIIISTKGDPLVLIPLSKGGKHGDGKLKYALTTVEAYELIKDRKWRASYDPTVKSFYALSHTPRRGGKRTTLAMHRMILGLEPGDKTTADHKNRVTLDNRPANLRQATYSENLRNQRIHRDNASGFKGVHWDKRDRRWRAQIKAGGKILALGTFTTPEQAAAAYDQAALQHYGDFALTNDMLDKRRAA